MRLVLRNVLRLLSSRGGLNLMEEKATKKMSSHSFTNLNAAQVGSLLAYVVGHVSRGGNKYVINQLFCSRSTDERSL